VAGVEVTDIVDEDIDASESASTVSNSSATACGSVISPLTVMASTPYSRALAAVVSAASTLVL